MGTRGPVPKRSNQRRRRNEPETPVTKADGAPKVEIPAADSKWHPVAKRWFESLASSGQMAFYQASDWATAYLVAESMSRDLKPQPIGVDEETGKPVVAVIPLKGASLTAYLKAFTALMVTEGDRRRLGLELQRSGSAAEAPEVPNLDDYRRRAG